MHRIIFIAALALASCGRPPMDGVSHIAEQALKEKEAIEIQIIPYKNPLHPDLQKKN